MKFRIRYTPPNGRRRSETFSSLELARQALAARQTDLERGRLGFAGQTNCLTIKQLANHYLNHHIYGGRIDVQFWQSKEQYRFNRLLTGFGDLKTASITPLMVEGWRKQQLDSGRTAETVRRDILMLKAFFNKGVAWGVIPINPLLSIKTSRTNEQRRPDGLTHEEVHAILDRLSGQYKAFALILCHTGLRRREALELHWSDVNLFNRTLTVRPEIAKSRRQRVIPLNSIALQVLFSLPRTDELIFPNITVENIRSALTRVFKKLDIAKPGQCHLFRHYFASKMLEQAVDLKTIQTLLGHQSIAVTSLYLHSDETQQRSAVEKLAG
jgi:integrase